MIDFHSHILPKLDDGSGSVEESLEMLKMLKAQGVETAAATPHFYADQNTVEEFIIRRSNAYNSLVPALDDTCPAVLQGAEVRYYSGISRISELDKLCLEGTNLLLLEMPEIRWTEFIVKELIELAGNYGITLVIAHIERCVFLQKRKSIDRLLESGILFQANASFFNEIRTRRKAFSMLKKSEIHFIGSDCHDLKYRPPKIGKALEIIENKFGRSFVFKFNRSNRSVFGV